MESPWLAQTTEIAAQEESNTQTGLTDISSAGLARSMTASSKASPSTATLKVESVGSPEESWAMLPAFESTGTGTNGVWGRSYLVPPGGTVNWDAPYNSSNLYPRPAALLFPTEHLASVKDAVDGYGWEAADCDGCMCPGTSRHGR